MNLRARPATFDDMYGVWLWRNDPATRAASFDTERVPLAEHRRWFETVLADPDRCLLVLEEDRQAVGVVRFDLIESSAWQASINLAPEHRGRGLAGPCLVVAVEWFAQRHSVEEVRAEIKTSNEASRKAFRRAGFGPTASDDGVEMLAWHPQAPWKRGAGG